jgi:hypothetical protein
MKKYFLIILILAAFKGEAQTNSYTFQAQDWAWLIGKNEHAINADSTTSTEYRKIRDQIRTANPASWTTNVTVNAVPDFIGIALYRTVKTGNAGEIAARYTAITTQIEGKASLATQISAFNLKLTNTDPLNPGDFERARNTGKRITMDQ